MSQPDAEQVVSLVDIESTIRKTLARLLESNGFQVQAFGEPEAFLSHAAREVMRVAVLDIWIPRMTVIDLLAYLGARSPQTRTIFVTAPEDRDAEPRLMSAGAFAFFLKPLNQEEFLDAVHRAFSQDDAGVEEASDLSFHRHDVAPNASPILKKMEPRTHRQTYTEGKGQFLARAHRDRAR